MKGEPIKFTLNEENPREKVILDFLSQHYNRAGTIKEILYDLITNNQVPSKYLVSTKIVPNEYQEGTKIATSKYEDSAKECLKSDQEGTKIVQNVNKSKIDKDKFKKFF